MDQRTRERLSVLPTLIAPSTGTAKLPRPAWSPPNASGLVNCSPWAARPYDAQSSCGQGLRLRPPARLATFADRSCRGLPAVASSPPAAWAGTDGWSSVRCAPGGALFVSPVQPGGTRKEFLGRMTYLDPKGERDNSMSENQ